MSGCIKGGLDEVKEQQEIIRGYVEVIAEVAATLEPGTEDVTERQERFEALIDQFERTEDPIRHSMAAVMLSLLAGLLVGEEAYEGIRDNLDLERWFRLPKSHERRIHGRRHVGVRIVVAGPSWCMPWMPTRCTRSPLRRTTYCRIGRPASRRVKPRR